MSGQQWTLWDGAIERYPYRAGAKERTTSKDAADQLESSGRAGTLRAQVLAWFASGQSGTADECAAALNETVLSIRPRVTELFRQGSIERTGVRRVNASGSSAHVWRLKAG
jgi:hypothetical protein